jgi:phosphonate transport system substrate-binding protein
LGSAGNPLYIAAVLPSEDQEASAALLNFAEQLTTKTGLTIKSVISQDYSTLLLSLQHGQTHITWLPPLTYLFAQEQESAQVALVSNHFGVYRYGVQFLANVASGFTPYFDPISKAATGDAAHALVQFAGKRPCLVEPTSPSGYILPLGILASESIQTLPAVLAQEETSVIRVLNAKKVCDFGATFAIMGDPRTAESLADLPDVLKEITVIWQSAPVIPNLNVSFSSLVNTPTRVKIRDAILEIAQNQDGLDLLSRAARYEIAGLKAVDDTYYADLKSFVEAYGGLKDNWIGK